MYISTKTYGHDIGLSCCFRQWRADSHCHYLHGYALKVRLEFRARGLDARNWVVDFGSLKPFKQILQDTFDHKMLVAEDDPMKDVLMALEEDFSLAQIVLVEATGCEAFAKLIYDGCEQWLKEQGHGDLVQMHCVEVAEHGANSAIYFREQDRGYTE